MIKFNNPKINACDQQAKIIQDRITFIEKNFAELCSIFSEYAQKNAALRDKSDELAGIINIYGENEKINKSLKNSLINVSNLINGLGDHRDIQVHRIESKIIANFSQYESLCKHAKEEVKAAIIAQERNHARKKILERIIEKYPRDRLQISQAESEAIKASSNMTQSLKNLEEQTDAFEKRKLHDIKQILLNFAITEIAFHTKALEFSTKIYQEISKIDIEEDFKEFRNTLKTPELISRLETVRKTSFRRNSNFSFSKFFNTSLNEDHLRIPSQGIPGSQNPEPIASSSFINDHIERTSITSEISESNNSKPQKTFEESLSTDSDD